MCLLPEVSKFVLEVSGDLQFGDGILCRPFWTACLFCDACEWFAFDEFPLFCSLVPKLVAGVTVYQGRQAAWCLGDPALPVSGSQAHL